jgi:hypothetical protein
MPATQTVDPLQRAKEHAFYSLSYSERQTANLYVSRQVVDPGAPIGPPFQEISARESSVLVFADMEPRSGFGHPCRYLFYDPESGAFQRVLEAQFPPFAPAENALEPFHLPVRETPTEIFRVRPPLACPHLVPDGERYAILFSGWAFPRNLNDLEFSYRTIVDRYRFRPQNVYVHLFDGTLASADGPAGLWAGDGTPFRMQVTGPGTRAALGQTLTTLRGLLGSEDLLFLHTENEAAALTESALVEPSFTLYRASDLAADIGSLPAHDSLIALMASCYSTGFQAGLLASSSAARTSVSCASAGNTAVSPAGWQFMKFGCDWLSAQAGHDPFGAPLAFNPDSDGNGLIAAEEAYAYAYAQRAQPDTPSFGETSEAGGDISLAQRYEWWWCRLVLPLLEPYYWRLPEADFYSTLNSVLPEVQQILPSGDGEGRALRKKLQPTVRSILASAFEEVGR